MISFGGALNCLKTKITFVCKSYIIDKATKTTEREKERYHYISQKEAFVSDFMINVPLFNLNIFV